MAPALRACAHRAAFSARTVWRTLLRIRMAVPRTSVQVRLRTGVSELCAVPARSQTRRTCSHSIAKASLEAAVRPLCLESEEVLEVGRRDQEGGARQGAQTGPPPRVAVRAAAPATVPVPAHPPERTESLVLSRPRVERAGRRCATLPAPLKGRPRSRTVLGSCRSGAQDWASTRASQTFRPHRCKKRNAWNSGPPEAPPAFSGRGALEAHGNPATGGPRKIPCFR